MPHPKAIQLYPVNQFFQLQEVPEGATQNGFANIGIVATPLQINDSESDDIDPTGDEERALQPQADTAPGQVEETARLAAEMVKSGDMRTPAEKQSDLGKDLSSKESVEAQVKASQSKNDDAKTEKKK